MLDALLSVSAVTPALLVVIYIQTRDLFPEPRHVIWRTFAWGVAIVVPVVLIGLPTLEWVCRIDSLFWRSLAHAFCVAAIPEELCKFLVLYFYCSRHHAFDEPMDGVVYGVTASLGFATFENVLYVVDGGFPVALSRALTALPCHAFLGIVMGYYVGTCHGWSKSSHQTPAASRHGLKLALLVPILFHGLYDFPLLHAQWVFQAEGEITGIALHLLGLLPLVLGALFVASFAIIKSLSRAQRIMSPAVPPPPRCCASCRQ